MTVSEALTLFRTWADDRNAPYLWPDAEVWTFLTLAQQDACRRARLIRDRTTPAVCSIPLLTGVARYAFHPSVLSLAEGAYVVLLDGDALCSGVGPHFLPERTGRPTRYWETETHLIVDPVPTVEEAAASLALDVYRLPLLDIVAEDSVFEVPEAVQEGLIAGSLARAYAKKDADTFSPEQQDRWEAEFTRWFGPRIDAAIQRDQRDRRPRVVRCAW